jgi:methylated-DNA-[protein]-cysteine S-methyltransferase
VPVFRYTVVETKGGFIGLLASEEGLAAATLPCPTREDARRALGERAEGAVHVPSAFRETARRLRDYFEGVSVSFPETLDIAAGTLFQRGVWRVTAEIPWGETRSYGWIAARLGRPGAARAAGNALGRNPLPIFIPCHRVTSGDGTLGGFTGGLEHKRHLLGLEGIYLPERGA